MAATLESWSPGRPRDYFTSLETWRRGEPKDGSPIEVLYAVVLASNLNDALDRRGTRRRADALAGLAAEVGMSVRTLRQVVDGWSWASLSMIARLEIRLGRQLTGWHALGDFLSENKQSSSLDTVRSQAPAPLTMRPPRVDE